VRPTGDELATVLVNLLAPLNVLALKDVDGAVVSSVVAAARARVRAHLGEVLRGHADT